MYFLVLIENENLRAPGASTTNATPSNHGSLNENETLQSRFLKKNMI